jgi:hypothetical protein
MNKSNLQIGSELVAINKCTMNRTFENSLVIGKKYPIVEFTEDEDNPIELAVVIIDEQNENHLFSIADLENYFTF